MTKTQLVYALAIGLATPLAGQDRGADAPPPGFPIEQWVVDFFNRSTTTRVVGGRTITSSTVMTGDVATLGGRLIVEGEIEGTLVAINTNVEIRPGARVGGNVIVVGGTLEDAVDAEVGGSLRRHSATVDVTYEDDRLVLNSLPASDRRTRSRLRFRSLGRSSIIIGLGNTYNRVEGLPMRLGLRFVWGGRLVESRLRGYGVFRTAGRFEANRQDMGYSADWAFRFGRERPVTVTARTFDLVVPTQSWPLETTEVGWAALLWHRDYRDYFLQRGFSGNVSLAPLRDLTIEGEYAKVEEDFILERDPWTPFRNDDVWRPQPAIDAGDFDLLSGIVTYDTRPVRQSRRSGWFLHGQWEHVVGRNVVERPLPPGVRDPLPTAGYSFDRGTVDIRRYQRVGRGGQLRLRGMWAGRIAGDPLPVQRRYALGGPDPLNGYAFRAFSCNAASTDPALTGLCDHVLLFQGEFRGNLSFDWFSGDGDDFERRYTSGRSGDRDVGQDDWGFDVFDDVWWFDDPTLVLFSNAGTGWLDGAPVGALNFDVGAGLEIAGLGIYVAKAINESEPVRVTLRIARRF